MRNSLHGAPKARQKCGKGDQLPPRLPEPQIDLLMLAGLAMVVRRRKT
jgi:hypothetical protein